MEKLNVKPEDLIKLKEFLNDPIRRDLLGVPPVNWVLSNATNTNTILFTISPNAKAKHSVSRKIGNKFKMVKVPYYLMDHKEQSNYLDNYVNEVYRSYRSDAQIIYTYELNGQNNLHIHGMMINGNIEEKIELKMFQKHVYANPLTILNMSRVARDKMPVDWMNNISFYEGDVQKIMYIFKDVIFMKKHFKPVIYNISNACEIKINFPI